MQKYFIYALSLWMVLFNFQAYAQTDQQNDDTQIKQIIDAYYEAWNQHDAKKIATFYASDGDVRTPWNEIGTNRKEVEAVYAHEFKRYTKNANIKASLKSIKMIKPGLAFLDVETTITGIPTDTTSIPFHHHVVYVLQKNNGKWQILISRPF